MQVETKDILYLLTYIITIIAMFLSFKHQLSSIAKDQKRSDEVIFSGQGTLNLVDCETCKCNRDQIFEAIRRSESMIEKYSLKMDYMSDNIVRIMEHLKMANQQQDS